ncbi:MAG: hypothetical protein ACOVNR_00125 [Chitinophagaceae bacterium]
MLVELDDTMRLNIVQQLFNDMFPFLKIEFFEQDVKVNGNVAARRHISNTNRKLGEFRHRHSNNSNVGFRPEMTVNELEKSFAHLYHLQTQVFRKSGKIWLETTITDGWSLDEQNRQGEIITAQMGINK